MEKNSVILGIDFGTTNSCVSFYDTVERKVHVIPNMEGKYTTPTCVFFDIETDEKLYGDSAFRLLNSNNNTRYLGNIVHNIKRLIGVLFSNLQTNKVFQTFFENKGINIVPYGESPFCFVELRHNNETSYLSVVHVVSLFLAYVIQYAKSYVNRNIEGVVVTVPAYFTDLQRHQIKVACENIGMNVLRIINEPTSAALAYAFFDKANLEGCVENILVIDCGGGTTDLSLVQMDYDEMVFEVKCVFGYNYLGGEDLTHRLMDYVCERKSIDKNALTTKQLNRLLKHCEDCKLELSYNAQASVMIENFVDETDLIETVSRAQFVEISREFFGKIEESIMSMSFSNKVDKVVFVGGTTRVPHFQDVCKRVLGKDIRIYNSLDPDQTISIGASIQGALMSGKMSDDVNADALVLDVIPLSLGIETIGGIMTPIISKNTPIPVTRSRIFSNSEDHVDSVSIDIYQGERKFVKDNEFLANFELQDVDPTYKKGELKIKVSFEIDSNGMISAMAEDMTNASSHVVSRKVTVTKMYSNDDKKIQDILETAECEKMSDVKRANMVLAKLELYDSFKYLLSVFQDRRDDILGSDDKNFKQIKLNEIFNDVFNTIQNYEKYTPDELKAAKMAFEDSWHEIVFGFTFLVSDDGSVVKGGSSTI